MDLLREIIIAYGLTLKLPYKNLRFFLLFISNVSCSLKAKLFIMINEKLDKPTKNNQLCCKP